MRDRAFLAIAVLVGIGCAKPTRDGSPSAMLRARTNHEAARGGAIGLAIDESSDVGRLLSDRTLDAEDHGTPRVMFAVDELVARPIAGMQRLGAARLVEVGVDPTGALRVRNINPSQGARIDVEAVLLDARARFDGWVATHDDAIATALADAAKLAGTDPPTFSWTDVSEGCAPTWLARSRRLRVLYLRRVVRWTFRVEEAHLRGYEELDNRFDAVGIEIALEVEFFEDGRVAEVRRWDPRPMARSDAASTAARAYDDPARSRQ